VQKTLIDKGSYCFQTKVNRLHNNVLMVGVHKLDKADFETYLKGRFFSELEYYESKAMRNKEYCQLFQVVIIVFSVLTPIFLATGLSVLQIIAVMLSGVVAIATSVLGTFKFQENWLSFRTVAESLKREKILYDSKNCEYESTEDPEKLFVLKIETLISKEHNTWTNYHQIPKETHKSENQLTQ